MAVDVFSLSQFQAARDKMVNGLVETATQSAFWVPVRLLEDVVLLLSRSIKLWNAVHIMSSIGRIT